MWLQEARTACKELEEEVGNFKKDTFLLTQEKATLEESVRDLQDKVSIIRASYQLLKKKKRNNVDWLLRNFNKCCFLLWISQINLINVENKPWNLNFKWPAVLCIHQLDDETSMRDALMGQHAAEVAAERQAREQAEAQLQTHKESVASMKAEHRAQTDAQTATVSWGEWRAYRR